MFNVGGGEILVIALIALIVLGPQRLPSAARQVGKTMGELRRMSSGFQQELRSALDDGEATSRTGPARNVLGAKADDEPAADPVTDAVRAVSEQARPSPQTPTPRARRAPLRAAPAADDDGPSAGPRRSAPR